MWGVLLKKRGEVANFIRNMNIQKVVPFFSTCFAFSLKIVPTRVINGGLVSLQCIKYSRSPLPMHTSSIGTQYFSSYFSCV